MIKILFVCLGNICRSPMAEAICNKKLKEARLTHQISCDSAGTASYHVGEDPDPRTIQVVEKNQAPIRHKGQQFQKEHQKAFDYLVAMDRSNYTDMVTTMGENPDSLKLMRDYDSQGSGLDVPDPWYGDMREFKEVYDILDDSISRFLTAIKKAHHL